MKTEELRKIVETLKPAFKLNDISEFGKYIVFANDMVFVYNGTMAIVMDYKTEQEFVVPADEFSKFVNRVKSKEIDITINETIDIKAGHAKASFALNNEMLASAKKLPINIPEQFIDLPKDFVKGLKLCQYSVGKDKSYEDLTHINVDGNVMASTDNFRVSEYTMASQMDDMMIPNDSIKYIISFDVTKYALTKGTCYFKNEDVIFITRNSNLLFPDYVDYLDADGEEVEFPEDMIDMVDTASVTVEGIVDIDKNIKIDIADHKIVVSSENEVGRISVDGEIKDDGELALTINPMFLTHILKMSKKVIVWENRGLLEIENFRHVVALLN